MSTEAMKLAVRSLKELVPDDSDHAPAIQGQRKRRENALKALQQALAQPQQEPVAWMSDCAVGFRKSEFGATPTVPLYTSPPAQRKPLTDEEIREIVREVDKEEGHIIHFARAIEAAHGIKGDA